MQIGKVEIHGGQVNFADTIQKIIYTENNFYTKQEFEEVKSALQYLPKEKLEALKIDAGQKPLDSNEEEKKSWGQKMKDKMLGSGVKVVEHMSAIVVAELLIHLFWGV